MEIGPISGPPDPGDNGPRKKKTTPAGGGERGSDHYSQNGLSKDQLAERAKQRAKIEPQRSTEAEQRGKKFGTIPITNQSQGSFGIKKIKTRSDAGITIEKQESIQDLPRQSRLR